MTTTEARQGTDSEEPTGLAYRLDMGVTENRVEDLSFSFKKMSIR